MPVYEIPRSFHFKVEFLDVSGVVENDIRFQDVSGLTAEMGIEEVQEGGENRFTHRLPTRAKYANLILKRGMLTDSGLIKWFVDAIENFEFTPSTVVVKLLDKEHEPLVTWNFIKAWPVKWTVSDFKATENSIVIETIELAYQYFRRQS
ncbi:MAG: phage tail protein [Ferruginibacter sp.]|nr:phage tail protein [Ferruginibacter sp.]